jgi:hypothetical protein
MLEIEDLMLDGSSAASLNTFELTQLLSGNVHDLVEILRRFGPGAADGRMPAATSGGQFDLLVRRVRAHVEGADGFGAATALPRVSIGPAHDTAAAVRQSPGRDGDLAGFQREPEQRSSDYLYDYFVLGFLDMLGRTRMEQ